MVPEGLSRHFCEVRRANKTDLLESRCRFKLLGGVKGDYARQGHGGTAFET